MAKMPDDHPTTFDRGLSVLEALAAAQAPDGLTLTEISRRVNMHRSTVFRFLATLHARGYVTRDATTGAYRLGSQVLTLAATWLNELDIRQVARPMLRQLCDSSRELVHLTILDQGDVVTVDRIEGLQPVSLQTGIGNRRPAHCTAAGKAMLAFLPAAEADRIVTSGLAAATPGTITSPDLLRRQFTDIRRLGYAIDFEEHFEGVCCVAAPVFGFDQRVVASISIAGPAHRMPHERIQQLGEEVCSAAAMVSRQLGYAGERATGQPEVGREAARHPQPELAV